MSAYKSFTDALSAPRSAPVAANDNRKQRKAPEPRYRGTLPALRWLYDNHPELAGPMASAVQSLTASNWETDVTDNVQEIRPTVGELIKAATDPETGEWLKPVIASDKDGNNHIRLGSLKFKGNELVEYGQTKKGTKLRPRDRTISREDAPGNQRDLNLYVFRTNATTPSPMDVEPYRTPISDESALFPMYAPLDGVEEARSELVAHGVDGSIPFDGLPSPATRCPTAIANGSVFLGGVVGSSGNASSCAVDMGDLPDAPKGEAWQVVEAVASGATLTEIGKRMGIKGARVDRQAKAVLVEAAQSLAPANDNANKKLAA